MPSSPNPYRLPRTVVPSAYRLFLTPDIDEATFDGRVEIDVEIRDATDRITMNAIDLDLGAATVSIAGTSLRSRELVLDATYQTATFGFEGPVPAGFATIEVAFSGVLNDRLRGFYRSTFTDQAGVTHTIATTQLQECDARRVFPCWDEPSFKATFQTNLTVPGHLAAYSNSPVTSDTDLGNGQRTVSFSPTMKMSTYLVAFVVGPFEETAPQDVLGTPVRIVYPTGKGHLAAFALDTSAFALDFFSQYFDIPYPGEKLDMIAVPDFAFGAMENLGCVIYRESDLLIDPATASLAEKRRVTTVVAHETAHMWFGDLVTMAWWEGIWLNEAFATFMEVMCSNAMNPEWTPWDDFASDRDIALQIDGLHATRPIETEIVNPNEALALVGPLTYQKGGSVLRMLEQFLGESVFRDAIRLYLRRHSYANTVTTDLWDALEEVSGHPVRDLMNTWILQGGHPLITLSGGVISQEPFAYHRASGPSAIGSTWSVPVLVRSLEGGPVNRVLLGDEPADVVGELPLVLNAGGSGVYRSRYGSDELAALAPRLDELTELERTTLVTDSWALLFAGLTRWDDFYLVARSLGNQDEPGSWSIIATAVDFIHRALRDDQRVQFAQVVRELFEPRWARLGWDPRPGDGELTAQVRAIVLRVLGTLGGDEAIRSESRRRFEADETDGDLGNAILRVVAESGEESDYQVMRERYRNARTPQSEQRYLHALAGFDVPALALDLASMCFTEVRSQDAPLVLATLSRLRVCGPEVWRYVTGRWDDALKSFPTYLIPRLLLGLATYITDDAFAVEAEAFHRAHPLELQRRLMEQAIERMHVGLAFTTAIRPQF
ncbi:MAG TPA: M1 family metallopeptidase [Acidimicrobiales bacterium]|nr:M1 family metallopeptidase [Acidimicrobiales bacterium]